MHNRVGVHGIQLLVGLAGTADLMVNQHGEEYSNAVFERENVPAETQTPNGGSLRQPRRTEGLAKLFVSQIFGIFGSFLVALPYNPKQAKQNLETGDADGTDCGTDSTELA